MTMVDGGEATEFVESPTENNIGDGVTIRVRLEKGEKPAGIDKVFHSLTL